jgi:hypothetical protein
MYSAVARMAEIRSAAYAEREQLEQRVAELESAMGLAAQNAAAALARKDALLRQAMEALTIAHTGLEWYRGVMPEYVDSSDGEADTEINAAIAAIGAELGTNSPADDQQENTNEPV